MAKEQQGNRQSELWISLDETVKRTGVSKRNILEWVSSGLVKKEKKRGMVYLWVDDLVKQTPLSTIEPQEIQTTTEIISPETEPLKGSALPAMRHIGEQIQKSLDNQSEMFEQISEINQQLSKRPENLPLDEKTIKELSLLGSVFRSIHQQNESIGQSLNQQDGLLKDIHQSIDQNADLQKKVDSTQGKLIKTLIAAACLLFICLGAFFFFYNNLNNDKKDTEKELGIKTGELDQTISDLNTKKTELNDKNAKIDLQDQTIKSLNQNLEQEKSDHQSLKAKHGISQSQLNTTQNELSQKEKDIEALKKKHEAELSALKEQHKESRELNQSLQAIIKKQESFEETLKNVDKNIKKDLLFKSISSGNQL